MLAIAIAGSLFLVWVLTVKSVSKPASETGLEADPVSGDVLYEVPPKNIVSLGQDLQRKGLIRNATVFRFFLRATRQDKKIRAGYFYVRPSNSILEMAFKLTSGKMATQVVTIPEDIWETYSILKARFPLDSLRFDSLVHSREFTLACNVDAPSLQGFSFRIPMCCRGR